MRKKMVAGNWKMNKTLPEGIKLVEEIKCSIHHSKCEVVVAVPYIHLATIAPILEGSCIGLGAENCANHASGAFTGEISAEMIASTGTHYCIIGHSERRIYYHEDYETLREKVDLALANKLKPIFCIGEVKEEREANCQKEVVQTQLEKSLFHLPKEAFSEITLAYEPVWAIGTGLTATPQQAQQMHSCIREFIKAKYGEETADRTTILYGGSCNEKNAKELFEQKDVDGGLIGGASLSADKFLTIVEAMNGLLQ